MHLSALPLEFVQEFAWWTELSLGIRWFYLVVWLALFTLRMRWSEQNLCKQWWKILREERTARPKLEFFYRVTQHLPEFTQTHVHLVGDAIQPSHPLLPPSPSAFYLSQNQGLSQWVDSSHQEAKLLELQHQSFQWIFRKFSFPLGMTAFISLQSKGLSRDFSSTTIQNHQFFGTHPSWWSSSHIHTWLLEKP